MHRDEFEEKFGMKLEYPVILKQVEQPQIVIAKEELEKFTSLDEMISAVQNLEVGA